MASPKPPGRMIRRSIAVSRGVANLGPAATAIYCMLIPHLDSYGKMLGAPASVKETALPLAKWATVEVIEQALQEISLHTNLKWWLDTDGRRYLHAVHFEKHQDLRKDRRGADHFPSYPESVVRDLVPDLVPAKVREVEVKKREGGKEQPPRTIHPCADACGVNGTSNPPPLEPIPATSIGTRGRPEDFYDKFENMGRH